MRDAGATAAAAAAGAAGAAAAAAAGAAGAGAAAAAGAAGAAAAAAADTVFSRVLPTGAFAAARSLLLAADTPDPLLQHQDGVPLDISLFAAAFNLSLLCNPCSRVFFAAVNPTRDFVNPKP